MLASKPKSAATPNNRPGRVAGYWASVMVGCVMLAAGATVMLMRRPKRKRPQVRP